MAHSTGMQVTVNRGDTSSTSPIIMPLQSLFALRQHYLFSVHVSHCLHTQFTRNSILMQHYESDAAVIVNVCS